MINDIVASVVVFKNDKVVLRKAIDSFLRTDLKVNLLVIDNSPTDDLRGICALTIIIWVLERGIILLYERCWAGLNIL